MTAATQPLVSVVTPSYNQARFLERTIRSVTEQAYPALEYFIMDGGSTDESRAIISRYADRITGWVSEPDAGQADAVVKGWRRSRGEILAYLNSDDLYLPGYLERAAACFAAHPDAGIVYGACQVIDEDGRPGGQSIEPPEVSAKWLLRYPLTQPGVFIRRTVIDQIGWLDTTLHYVFDWEFFLRAFLAQVVFRRIPGAPLACFRSWQGQKTAHAFERQLDEQFRIRDRLLSERRLAAGVLSEVQFSKAWAFLWPAYQSYLGGAMGSARHLLHRAARADGRIVTHPAFLGLYARTWLGPAVSRRLRGAKAKLLDRVAR